MLGQCTVVVPTIGRPSLDVLLDALAAGSGPRPAELLIVADRPPGRPRKPPPPHRPPPHPRPPGPTAGPRGAHGGRRPVPCAQPRLADRPHRVDRLSR